MSNRLTSSPIVQQLLRGSYRSVGPALPDGTEVVDPGQRFTFRVPWPWYELSPYELEGSSTLGAPADVVVTCPRTDGRDPLFWLLSDDDQVDLEQANVRRLMRSMLSGTGLKLTAVERILVDGLPAALAVASPTRAPADDVAVVLLAPHPDGCVSGRADLPGSHADGYHSHLRSMLATWRWAR